MAKADMLPEMLYMASDAGKLVFEHDMGGNRYPLMTEWMKE